MAAVPALWIEGLWKQYDGHPAVQGLGLSVFPGEVFGLIGPNGAGKTTTIKIVVGLLKPDAGRAAVFGQDIFSHPVDYKAAVGYLPEASTLPDYLTGDEFLTFVGRLRDVPRPAIRQRIDALLARLDLADRKRDLIVTYSKGMRQKIAFAASVIHEPRLLIMDEPLLGVDPAGQYEIKEVARDVVRRGGAAVVSTHMLDTAEKLCDRLAVVHHGRLAAMGTLAELRSASQAGADATLEQVFLRLTEEAAQPPPPDPPKRGLFRRRG